MRVFGAIRWLFRSLRPPSVRAQVPPPDRPEIAAVNRIAGTEPICPELSGLRLRRPAVPMEAVRVLEPASRRRMPLTYRWRPSDEYRRRQDEARATNSRLDRRRLPVTPPVLLFPEETEVAPSRLQTHLGQQEAGHPFMSGELPLDLEMETVRRQSSPLLQPRLPEVDPDLFLSYRHLLPRPYRHFLRHSPWPRLIAAIVLGVSVAGGALWLTQLERAAAAAAGQVNAAHRALRAELAAAGTYGVDPHLLRPLMQHAHALAALAAPAALLPSHTQVEFYRAQARRYTKLLQQTRRLERRAFQYWTWDEGITYAALMEAQQNAATFGLQLRIPPIPTCATPRCFRAAVTGQQREIRWLRQTADTLQVYGAAVQTAADPAAAAAAETDLAHKLAAVTSPSGVPAPLSALDAALATAATVNADAHAGALAHLDADFLFRRLLATTPGKLIVVDTEDGQVTCYQNGKTVSTAIATAGAATPTGRFHLGVKQAVIAATYWLRAGGGYRYRYGAIPDWMQFSGDNALQGAPWRGAFGPGTDGLVAGYGPSTPGSVDLPPAAAGWIFNWAPAGTEVVVV